ncbi:hypothetical protein AOQ84DRAFT_154437 [Glonium stellatum]|uniref:DUF7730 domain-containing protein n=1 Tax=Glonium stellatum TaxID=574774 RepID=A0A8E2ER19_9PEZI|nr:hypothetical protein AOQ84DRAFT_154437 [Glonium stellatum]
MAGEKSSLSLEWRPSRKIDDHSLSILDLPRELRDIVYEYVCQVPGEIFIYWRPSQFGYDIAAKNIRGKYGGPSEPIPLKIVMSTALMKTCRQIHAECSPILYGHNNFSLLMPDRDFVSATYLPLIRHITLISNSDTRLFDQNAYNVSLAWRATFWPLVSRRCEKLLGLFPKLQSIRYLIYATDSNGNARKPAFIKYEGTTREDRIDMAATWFRYRCPFGSDRLRDCLNLEITPPPSGTPSATDLSEPGAWDISEFSEAFERMKLIE